MYILTMLRTQPRTCSARLNTSHKVLKIKYCSPLHSYQHSVLCIHTSMVNPQANSNRFLKASVSSYLAGLSMRITNTL